MTAADISSPLRASHHWPDAGSARGGGRYVDAGATVAVNYRSNAGAAEHLAQELRSRGHRAASFGGDVTDPAAIAKVVCFLLSPQASYITGATLDVAGGWMR